MGQFIRVSTGTEVDQCVANGDYEIIKGARINPVGFFTFGATKAGAGASASVQLWKLVAGTKVNLGAALTVTNASPGALADEYSACGIIGFTVANLNGTDDVLVPEVLQ